MDVSETMELSKDTLETIGSYVKGNLPAWLRELSPEALGQTDLRIAREEIQHLDKRFEEQRQLFLERFAQLDKRFEEQREDFAARFQEQREDFAARFQEQRERFEARFVQVDKRFEEQRADMNARFEEHRADMNARFEEHRGDMHARFGDMHRHTNRWMTVLVIMVGLIGVAVTVTNVVG